MEAVLSPEERLERVDREIDDLKRGFVDAIGQLQQTPEIDDSFADRLAALSERLSPLRRDLRPADFDKEQIVEIHDALWEIRELIDAAEASRKLDVLDGLLIRIERIRHVIRDALDEHVSGVQDDVGLVLQDLRRWLPTTPKHVLAELIGVDRRTLTRWASQSGPPNRRLRLVSRLVAVLRHNWTEEGIVAWFHRPRRELGGRRPISVIDDPGYDDALLAAARAGRSQYAG